MQENYVIRRRPAWEFMGEISVSIECDPLSPSTVKLGLAVRAAVKSGANLSRANLSRANLSRADLRGANLYGANLSGADLTGANLDGAYLRGADLIGAKIGEHTLTGRFAAARRSDSYEFFAFAAEPEPIIRAGCQTHTFSGYRSHVASEYTGGAKAEETLRILDFLEAQLAGAVW